MEWLILAVNLTPGKREPQLRSTSMRVACGHVCGAFSRLVINIGFPAPCGGGTMFAQMDLDYIRKGAEQACKQHSSGGLCQAPALASLEDGLHPTWEMK